MSQHTKQNWDLLNVQILLEAYIRATNLSPGLSIAALCVSKEHPQNNKDL